MYLTPEERSIKNRRHNEIADALATGQAESDQIVELSIEQCSLIIKSEFPKAAFLLVSTTPDLDSDYRPNSILDVDGIQLWSATIDSYMLADDLLPYTKNFWRIEESKWLLGASLVMVSL